MFWNDIKFVKDEMDVHKSSLLRIECALDGFENIWDRLDDIDKAVISQKTMGKFEDYMKNVDKLNSMVNEFKGCVSMARAAIEERKKLEEVPRESPIKEETLSKIDYIHYQMGKFAAFMQNCEKKSRKSVKKKGRKACQAS